MSDQLRYWKQLPKEKKAEFMDKYAIKVIIYSDIKMIYEKENKPEKPAI